MNSREMDAWMFSAQPRRKLNSAKTRRLIFLQVFSVHMLVIFVPLIIAMAGNYLNPQEVAYAVELVGPPSTWDEIGPTQQEYPLPPGKTDDNPSADPVPPENTEPQSDPVPEPDPAPTPDVPIVPEPDAAVVPIKRMAEPTNTVKPKPRPRPVDPSKNTAVKPPVFRPVTSGSGSGKTGADVYNPTGKYGNNADPKPFIPFGPKRTGQVIGPPNGSQGGGGNVVKQDAEYADMLGKLFKQMWREPPLVLINNQMQQVHIQVEIAPDGRVIDKKIIKSSGVKAMDDSVKALFAVLDRVKPPPGGRKQTISFILKTEEKW